VHDPRSELRRNNLCELLETHRDCVNIKAKTHEKVDSIGEERSIACHTVVMLISQDLMQQLQHV
jgi:2-C-methyl-D-erythritol 2,4-cyclodiphosphate synthase